MHLRELRKRKVYLKEYTNLQRKNKATATTTKKIHRVFLKTQHPSQAPGGSKPLNMQLRSFSRHALSSLFQKLFLSIVRVLIFLLWLVCGLHLLVIQEALNTSLRWHQQPKLPFLTLRIPNKPNFPNLSLWDSHKSWYLVRQRLVKTHTKRFGITWYWSLSRAYKVEHFPLKKGDSYKQNQISSSRTDFETHVSQFFNVSFFFNWFFVLATLYLFLNITC